MVDRERGQKMELSMQDITVNAQPRVELETTAAPKQQQESVDIFDSKASFTRVDIGTRGRLVTASFFVVLWVLLGILVYPLLWG